MGRGGAGGAVGVGVRGWAAPGLAVLALAVLAVAAVAVLGPGRSIPRSLAAVFGTVYLGVPLGLLVSLRGCQSDGGSRVLLMATVVVSDSLQYYTGRLFGRRPLAPAISPKKTVEGAVGGVAAAALFLAAAGPLILPGVLARRPRRARGRGRRCSASAATCSSRSSSAAPASRTARTLIPGHGGVLDRVDALLFAMPAFYLYVRGGIVKRLAILGSTGSIGRSALVGRRRASRSAAGGRRWPPATTPSCWRSRRSGIARRSWPWRRPRPPTVSARHVRRSQAPCSPAPRGWSRSRPIPRPTSCCARRRARPGSRRCWPRSSGQDASRWPTRKCWSWPASWSRRAARRRGVSILPVDSEHNAIHQCLHGRGGATRCAGSSSRRRAGRSATCRWQTLEPCGPDAALRHPDLADGPENHHRLGDLMNKGLEVIEAHWLFGVPADAHRRGDPSAVDRPLAGGAERRLGDRAARGHGHAAADPVRLFRIPSAGTRRCPGWIWRARAGWSSRAPDLDRFPCLGLAYRALREGGTLPVVLNAANEVAVAAFLEGRLGFTAIPRGDRAGDERRTAPNARLISGDWYGGWTHGRASHAAASLPAS